MPDDCRSMKLQVFKLHNKVSLHNKAIFISYLESYIYMAHHFIMLRLNPFGLRADRDGWWFEHSVS